MSLEDQVKTIPGLQKLIEQYKQEKLDMENARFEEFTASKVSAAHLCNPAILRSQYLSLAVHCLATQLKDAEILKLRDELESAQSAKRFLTEELSALRKCQADGQTDDNVYVKLFSSRDPKLMIGLFYYLNSTDYSPMNMLDEYMAYASHAPLGMAWACSRTPRRSRRNVHALPRKTRL